MLKSKRISLDDLEFIIIPYREALSHEEYAAGIVPPPDVDDFVDTLKKIQDISDGLWGWCNVTVVGFLRDDINLKSVERQNCCAYKDQQHFMGNLIYQDMCKCILIDIQKQLDDHISYVNKMIANGVFCHVPFVAS